MSLEILNTYDYEFAIDEMLEYNNQHSFLIFYYLLYFSKCIQWSHINCLIAKNVEIGAFVLWNMTYAWMDNKLGKTYGKTYKVKKRFT